MRAVTHLEKVITGEVSAVTHLEKVIAGEVSAVTYIEKVIAGEATPITHLQKVIAGVASPVTHLEQVWAGGSPTPSEHEYTGAVPVTITADGTPLLDFLISGNEEHAGTPSSDNPIIPQGTGDLETVGVKAGQYKITISSADTTTTVYLGEVQTTRRIKKLVFDGTENLVSGSVIGQISYTIPQTPCIPSTGLCSHYTLKASAVAPFNFVRISYASYNNGTIIWFELERDQYSTKGEQLAAFKQWLSAQYSAGTPVTIWYVLATEETGIVNEPLMKIGEYADAISMEQARVSIPTLNGQTVIDVDTALKPSEMYIKYKG